MSPHQTAKIAVGACMTDLRERSGFRELISGIPDWREIEAIVVMRTEQAIVKALEAEQTTTQSELDGF